MDMDKEISLMTFFRGILFLFIFATSGTTEAEINYYGPPYFSSETGKSFPSVAQTVEDDINSQNESYRKEGDDCTCYLTKISSLPNSSENSWIDGIYRIAKWSETCYNSKGSVVAYGGDWVRSTRLKKNFAKNNGGYHYAGSVGSSGVVAGSTFFGDPINTSSGNKYLEEDDYTGNTLLTLKRFYNSSTTLSYAEMGFQWRHSFDRSLQLVGGSFIAMLRADGSEAEFTKNGNVWTTDADVADTLSETDNSQGVATGYILSLRQRVSWRHMT